MLRAARHRRPRLPPPPRRALLPGALRTRQRHHHHHHHHHTLVGRRCAPFALVDAFAAELHGGNPAAVVRLASFDELSTAAMQAIDAELAASATAFIAPVADDDADGAGADAVYDIRWFSVACELPLCGHATFGSAKALLAAGVHPSGSRMLFRSQHGGGDLTVSSSTVSDSLELSLASLPTTPDPDLSQPGSAARGELARALGLEPEAESGSGSMVYVGRNRYDLLVELDSAAAVEGLVPDQELLGAIECRGVIVTAVGSGSQRSPWRDETDFVCRFFGPSMGIPEDPATGSAQCALGPYWAARLGRSKELKGFQASARGGSMELSVVVVPPPGEDEEEAAMVVVRSTGQVVVDGTITLPSPLQ